jgi:hypothetical protein
MQLDRTYRAGGGRLRPTRPARHSRAHIGDLVRRSEMPLDGTRRSGARQLKSCNALQ